MKKSDAQELAILFALQAIKNNVNPHGGIYYNGDDKYSTAGAVADFVETLSARFEALEVTSSADKVLERFRALAS